MPIEKASYQLAVNGDGNKLSSGDRPAHDWFRFVLSFPPHLVRDYLTRFDMGAKHTLLDPFCGTGTTLVECKKLGIPSVGIEANPMACLASKVKVDWKVDPVGLLEHAKDIASAAETKMDAEGLTDDSNELLPLFVPKQNGQNGMHRRLKTLPPDKMKLLLTASISPLPLHKTLILLECLQENYSPRYGEHEKLALAKALVTTIGNLHFGPEVGVSAPKEDTAVIAPWLKCVQIMAEDLRVLKKQNMVPAEVHHADARSFSELLKEQSIDAVITSPPYPNEKDYTRTTRLESVLLGLINSKQELRNLKKQLVRSNTRGVYKDDADDRFVQANKKIQDIANAIEKRRIELKKTSGFERMYHRVTKLYFGGMVRHLGELRSVLRPGAHLAYVVGDQASYLRVMIRTGQLLAELAQSLGYELVSIDLFRTRLATATKEQLREEVVVLRWPAEWSDKHRRFPCHACEPFHGILSLNRTLPS